MKLLSLIAVAGLPDPTPQALFSWLGCAAALMSIALLAKNLFMRKPSVAEDLKKNRDENDIKIEQVRKEMLELAGINTRSHAAIYQKIADEDRETRKESTRLFDKLSNEMKAESLHLTTAAESRAKDLHLRINGVIDETNATIREIPAQTISLLKNTQRLHS